ncbi:MAG TPA: adenylate/guanylate cyclase domain-containing protein [Stellaceae bacterium]|nr:adenylate/guanylate cyclase domain-containing protein [Stellaceae bacterium]
MAELTSNLAAATLATETIGAGRGARAGLSARQVHRRLVWLEVKASWVAVIVMFILALFGLDFTVEQWGYALAAMPFCVAAYMIPDIYLLTRHFRPIGVALSRLDGGTEPTRAEASAAIARALNLPFFCFVRVNLIHGPLATSSILLSFEILNYVFGAGFALWQKLLFAGTALLFAAPTHAIFEYFSIGRDVAAPIARLSQFVDDGILPEHQDRLVSIRLRSKLLYLSIFIAGLPLIFFAISIVFKVDHILWLSSTALNADQLLPLWRWIVGVVAVCLVLAMAATMFTAGEVSRSAATLVEAMRKVEGGKLDADLSVTSTDEYADLFRGFNHMVRGLRDEARLIEVTQGLAGELNLDSLIQRIMSAATELMNAERATLFVYDPRTGQLWSRYAAGLSSGEIRIPSNAGIAGSVFTSGVTENIPDAYADPRFDRVVDHDTGYRTRNILCMPIANKIGARIGVTEVLNKKGNGGFTARDEAQLRAFTAQIAVLLENAQLFDEVMSVKNYNENILRSTSNGMITIDLAGRVVTANEAALAILKMKRGAMIGMLAAKLFAGKNGWVVDSVVRAAETSEPDVSLDASLKLADGNTVSVNMRAEPLFGPDRAAIGSMLVFEDITDETRAKATLRRHMSKEVADQLLASGDAALGGKMQTVTVLFSDVRNFTGLSEALGARETVSLLNEYFTDMVDVVSQHGGILDKYIGDAIMALFGVPFEKPEDADNALAVANGMLMALAALNQRRADRGQQRIDIGVGIATGEVVAGNIGSPTRVDYTVIGDSVNLASRLEGANKFYRTKILIDATTKQSLKNPGLFREIDLLQVKGKDHPVAVYESLGYLTGTPGIERMIDCFGQGLCAYRTCDWQKAIACFEAALAIRPDEPSRIYIERCRHYQEMPPVDDWGGVWVLTEK